jgi:hypothetical protein
MSNFTLKNDLAISGVKKDPVLPGLYDVNAYGYVCAR